LIVNLDKKNLRLFLLIAFAGAVIALGVGSFLAVRTVKFERRATRAAGVVIDNVGDLNGSQNTVSYYPKIRFRTQEGVEVSFISSNGNSDAEFHVGESVPVVYDPQRPTNAVIDSFWHRWTLPIILLGLGVVALIGAAVVQSSRQSNQEVVGMSPQVS
jgi:hypothetical protein